MAQLKDLLVNGATRLIGDVFTNKIQITAVSAPTASNGTTYGPGTNGQILKSNGTSVYWAADNNAGGTVTSITPGNGLLNGTGTSAITTSGTLNLNYGTSASAIGTASAGSATTVSRSDHVHNISLATGDNNGQVKIAGTNVSVKGLGSNAYTSTEYAKRTHSVYYVLGSSSGSAGDWTGTIDSEVTELYDGLTIIFCPQKAGVSNSTDRTLTNDNSTTVSLRHTCLKILGVWKPVYYQQYNASNQTDQRLTTHYGANAMILMTYRTAANNGSGGWVAGADYNSDQPNYRQLDLYFRPYAATEAIYRYKICALDKDNRLVPLTITNQTNGTNIDKTQTTQAFKPNQFWLYNTTTATSAGAVTPAQVLYRMFGDWSYPNYTFNTTIPAHTLTYLKGSFNSTTGLFTLDQTSHTSWQVNVPTNTANLTLTSYFISGNYYILMGGTYSANNYLCFFENNPMFYFDGTNLVQVTHMASKAVYDSAGDQINTTYLKLSGGTMTGGVTFVGNQASAYNDKGILFTNGSRIGENSSSQLAIYAGSNLVLRVNSPTASSGKGVEMTNTAFLPSATNEMTLGGTNNKWTTVYATTFKGNADSADKVNHSISIGDKSYDGSDDITIEIADLGLAGSSMEFKGIITNTLSDGATTSPVTLDGGGNLTPADGNVVIDATGKEYIWSNNKWHNLGIATDFALSAHKHGNITNAGKIGTTSGYALYTTTSGLITAGSLSTNSPSASGSTTSFIDTISQDTKGKITATKKNLDTSGTWSGNATTATTASKLACPNLNTETDVENGTRSYQGGGGNWTGSISSMQYAGILQVCGGYARGWQIWGARGASSALHWRNPNDDATAWGTERIILDSSNYSSYALPLSGGDMTGGISITHSTSNDIGYLVKNNNSAHQVGLIIGGSSGSGGLYDFTASKWIVYNDTSNNTYLNGKANSAGAIVTSGSVATRKVWVTTSASVPSGAAAGDIVLVKV